MSAGGGQPLAIDSGSQERVTKLMAHMSFKEKVGQLNQRLLGWKAIEKRNGKIVATDTLKREIDRWGGLGFLYGLYRADPWSGRDWSNGIRPEERPEAFHVLQSEVIARGAHGIGALLSEEAPHGHQALGGTILPTNLAMGATFDPQAVREAQSCVAGELAASGVQIALVSGLDIARDPRWGRCEECYGEDPHMAARFVAATVEGMQGVNRSQAHAGGRGVAVVLKHLAAQGEAVGGRNGQSAVLGPRDLREIHLPAVAAGVKAGAFGFMAAYNDIDSVPCCANSWLLKDYLRGELGFDGIVMADGLAVDRLESMTGSIPSAGRAALCAGVDVSLWDKGFASLDQFADDPQVVAAVDRSVRRVLLLKDRFGLLPGSQATSQRTSQAVRSINQAVSQQGNVSRETSASGSMTNRGATAERIVLSGKRIEQALSRTRTQAEKLSQKCLVLLKNDGSIPDAFSSLQKGGNPQPAAGKNRFVSNEQSLTKPVIAVVGPFADDFACFLGDYTAPVPAPAQTSIFRQLTQRLQGCDVRLVEAPNNTIDATAAQILRSASLVVGVWGGTSERSYHSSFASNGAAVNVGKHGATGGEGVDCADISLPWNQDALMHSIRQIVKGLIVSVVVAGRAHVLTTVMRDSNAVVWAGYAGVDGPKAVVDALLGVRPCPGRMPVTIVSNPGAVPIRYNDRQSPQGVYRDAKDPVLDWFGTGLGSLRGLQIGAPKVEHRSGHDIVSVFVAAADISSGSTNANASSKRRSKALRGCEKCVGSLNLYCHRVGGTTVPRQRELVGSTYLELARGEKKVVRWSVPVRQGERNAYRIGDDPSVKLSG